MQRRNGLKSVGRRSSMQHIYDVKGEMVVGDMTKGKKVGNSAGGQAKAASRLMHTVCVVIRGGR